MAAINKRFLGFCLIIAGMVTAAAGLVWLKYNLWDDHRAGEQAQRTQAVILQYREEISSGMGSGRSEEAPPSGGDDGRPEEEAPSSGDDDRPDQEMSALTIDGHGYIGTLSVPALGLELPVMEEWSYSNLKIAPCRYSGSVYSGDMVICAHNYTSHFGKLKDLQAGDAVIFTDTDGDLFSYSVAQTETLPPTAIEEMTRGDCPLTLFTCTWGGQARFAVRCQAAA